MTMWHALDEDAIAMANAIVTAMLDDSDGTSAYALIRSIIPELVRDLPDDMDELIQVLGHRCVRPAAMIEHMARMVADVVRACERAGLPIDRGVFASPYGALLDLEQSEGPPCDD
jgi:hypothetical protein